MAGNFSTIFCLIADPIDIASWVVGVVGFFARVIIDGSSIALARTI
jgi:hypothetical protein